MIEFAWVALLALSLLMYVTLDGYDLGMGMRLIFDRNPAHRRGAVEIVATAWDGNESWLVLLGLTLWTAFPLAYASILPHIYLPVVASILGLVLRGVAIEMVSQNRAGTTPGWVRLFIAGSFLAAFAQGMAFGALMSPVALAGGTSQGTAFAFLTPFSVLTGISTVLLYLALGTAYVRMKTEGEAHRFAGRSGRVMTAFAALFILITALSINATAAPLMLNSTPRLVVFVLLSAAAVAGGVTAFFWFSREAGPADAVPYFALVGATVAGFFALVVARYPVLLPPDLTIHSAAAPQSVLQIALIGVGLSVPFLLYYTWFAHHAFKGRYVAAPEAEAGDASADLLPALAPAMGTSPPQARPVQTRPVQGLLATVLRRSAWVLLGVFLYAVCINVFSKYPQYHSGLLTWIAIIGLSVFAAWVWLRDELRPRDTDG